VTKETRSDYRTQHGRDKTGRLCDGPEGGKGGGKSLLKELEEIADNKKKLYREVFEKGIG
jgi:hypothetical protein